MKRLWDNIRSILKRKDGMTLVEVLVSVAVLVVFSTAIVGTVIASNGVTEKSDVMSHFDRQNQAAIAAFKTNPDPDYLKDNAEPFENMVYNPTTKSFTQYYNKNFQPVNDSTAPYYVVYEYQTDTESSDFSTTSTGVALKIENQRRKSNGTYEMMYTSASKGTNTIHTINMNNSAINPSTPTDPDSNFYRVTFVLEGGEFTEDGSGTRVRLVAKGSPLKDVLPPTSDFSTDNPNIRFEAWKLAGTSTTIPADTTMNVDSDMAITGAYQGIPCTVNFKIPYYNGSWSNDPNGVTKAFVSKMGVCIDETSLASIFGKSDYSQLFAGGATLGGWFDEAGTEFKIGSDGTPLSDQWSGKTLVAKVNPAPSTQVKMGISVTEGPAKGDWADSANLPLTTVTGGKISEADIATATGKDYSKIKIGGFQDGSSRDRRLTGWIRSDDMTPFIPGVTELTSDWNGKTIETVYGYHPPVFLTAEINDRKYWDITRSNVDFVQTGDELKLKVTETATSLSTPASDPQIRYYNVGKVSEIKKKVDSVKEGLIISTSITYPWVDLGALLDDNPMIDVYQTGQQYPVSDSKFPGKGAVFALAPGAKTNLKSILGITRDFDLDVAGSVKALYPATKDIVVKDKLGVFAELWHVGPKGRKDNEKYKLKITKNGMEPNGTPTYSVGFIGENGDNILNTKMHMNPKAFDGQTVPTQGIRGNDKIILGDYTDRRGVDEIDTLTLLIPNLDATQVPGQYVIPDTGWRILFAQDSGSASYTKVPGNHNRGGSYRAEFSNVTMADGSDVKVKNLVVYIEGSDYPAIKPRGRGGFSGYLKLSAVESSWAGAENPSWVYNYPYLMGDWRTVTSKGVTEKTVVKDPTMIPNGFDVRH